MLIRIITSNRRFSFYRRTGFFFMLALFLDTSAFARNPSVSSCTPLMAQLMRALPSEYAHLKPKTVRDFFVWNMQQPDENSTNLAERRLKFETKPDGKADTADPVREVELADALGRKTWRVYSSGGRNIITRTQDDQYRGLLKSRAQRKIVGYKVIRKNGDKAGTGAYHTGDFGWDMLVITTRDGQQVGYAGLMADRDDQVRVPYFNKLHDYFDVATQTQRKYEIVERLINGEKVSVFTDRGVVDRDVPLTTSVDNHTRSRAAFSISYEKDKNGRWIEVWTEQGPVFPGRPTAEPNWVHGDFHHGYGGRPILGENNVPWVDADGYMWMMYERVTEQREFFANKRVIIDGQERDVLARQVLPYKTETVLTRMKDAYQTFRPGELMPNGQEGFKELVVSTVTASPEAQAKSGLDYYPATVRDYGADGKPVWFLREGGANLGLISVEGRKFWIKSESSGNYVSQKYNVILSCRTFEEGPVGPYKDILTPQGDLKRFFSDLAELGISWGFGRADFTFDSAGRFWFRGHGILSSDYPKWYPIDGWPPAQIFTKYFRRQILLPAEWRLVDGEPQPQMDAIKITSTQIENYLKQKRSRRRHHKKL